MKNSILTFAVFSLVVLTSFTSVNYTGDDSGDDNGDPTTTTTTTARQDSGGDHVGGNKKHDDIVAPSTFPYAAQYPNQDITTRKKTDF